MFKDVKKNDKNIPLYWPYFMSLINPAKVKDFPINFLLSLGDDERTQCHCGKMELGSYMFTLHDPWTGFSSAAPMKTLGLSPIDYFTQELNHHLKRKKKSASFDT